MTSILPVWAAAALVAGLALPAILPELANIATIATMMAATGLSIGTGSWRWFVWEPRAMLPLLASGILAMALVFTAKGPENFLVLALLVPLWLVGPHAALLVKLGTRLSPVAVATVAIVGAAGCAAICAYDVFVRGLQRGGELVMNPIHMGDLGLMLGFVPLIALFGPGRRWRAIFLTGPVLALITIQLTMARGPLIAYVAMLAVATLALALAHLPRRIVAAAIVLALVGVAAIMLQGSLTGWLLTIRGFDQIHSLLTTGTSGDGSVNQRLVMYSAAWEAFQASPWFGHGAVDFVATALSFVPPSEDLLQYEHLHADLANFAVIGGLLGIASYSLLIAAPLVGVIAATGPASAATRYLGAVAAVGYLIMGLTNAMFGILVLTVLYALVLSVMLALERVQPPA